MKGRLFVRWDTRFGTNRTGYSPRIICSLTVRHWRQSARFYLFTVLIRVDVSLHDSRSAGLCIARVGISWQAFLETSNTQRARCVATVFATPNTVSFEVYVHRWKSFLIKTDFEKIENWSQERKMFKFLLLLFFFSYTRIRSHNW